MADQIPGARFIELPGGPHMPYYGDWESVVNTIREFVEPICLESARPYDSVLATVLFTDLVGSTAKAAELGDRAWRELLEQHHARTRGELSRFRGIELDTAPILRACDGKGCARCDVATANEQIDADIHAAGVKPIAWAMFVHPVAHQET